MKVNCDAFGDWRKARREARKQWHRRFKFYVRLGHGDCRLFEFVEARQVIVEEERYYCDIFCQDTYTVDVKRWEYRAVQKLNH